LWSLLTRLTMNAVQGTSYDGVSKFAEGCAMRSKSLLSSAHGPGGRLRFPSVEMSFSPCATNSEFGRLKEVVLHMPDERIEGISDPSTVQHLERMDKTLLCKEMEDLIHIFKKCGIEVHQILSEDFYPKMMFCRDLFFNTARGVIVSRMASDVRAGEEIVLNKSVGGFRHPILYGIQSPAVLEGADILWVSDKHVLVGIGPHTNEDAVEQLQWIFKAQNIQLLIGYVFSGVQHLADAMQILDKDLAFIRREKVDPLLVKILMHQNYRIVGVDESEEVTQRQGFSFLTIAPRKVVMASGCPELKTALIEQGVDVVAEVEISEICKAGGGIARLTGILSRERVIYDV
jgi:N-dimethylarginine dimethylaminohydrolase